MAKILYTGSFRFPTGDAGAARVLGIGKALRDAGHEVFFAGGEEKEREEDRQGDCFYYQGFPYQSMNDIPNHDRSTIGRLRHFLNVGYRTIQWIQSSDLSPDMIISYHGPAGFLTRLSHYCKKERIALAVDNTEWHNSFQLPGGALAPPYWSQERRQRIVTPKIGNVIAISSYLYEYFKKRKCHVVQVPPLVDLQEKKWDIQIGAYKTENPDSLRLVYAGIPARKDNIKSVLQGICLARQQNYDVEMHLIGPTKNDLTNLLGYDRSLLTCLGTSLHCSGRLPQDQVPGELMKSDASVLLRPDKRYAHAGFSTKFVESLAVGLPVFTNQTSDIEKYVQDGKEAIIINGVEPGCVFDGIKKWFSWPIKQRVAMRESARLAAANSFDYRSYIDVVQQFVKECGK